MVGGAHQEPTVCLEPVQEPILMTLMSQFNDKRLTLASVLTQKTKDLPKHWLWAHLRVSCGAGEDS